MEADEQQVNLTRFSLFFPRSATSSSRTRASSPSATTPPARRARTRRARAFHSRRIGLANNREVPILGGGRVTGRLGRYQVGAVNMQTRADTTANAKATNFSVVRVKRDILRRSNVGVLVTSARSHRHSPARTSSTASTGRSRSSPTRRSPPTGRRRSRTDSKATMSATAGRWTHAGDRYGSGSSNG